MPAVNFARPIDPSRDVRGFFQHAPHVETHLPRQTLHRTCTPSLGTTGIFQKRVEGLVVTLVAIQDTANESGGVVSGICVIGECKKQATRCDASTATLFSQQPRSIEHRSCGS